MTRRWTPTRRPGSKGCSTSSISTSGPPHAGRDSWRIAGVPRLEIGDLKVTDGPTGARGDLASRGPGGLLPGRLGHRGDLGPRARGRRRRRPRRRGASKGAQVLLGPTVNIHRHPLAGRNFECYSEDPELTARLCVAFIGALQAGGVGASLKHFVGNDSEFERHSISSEIDERTLREVYLRPFEAAVAEVDTWTIMAAYNSSTAPAPPSTAGSRSSCSSRSGAGRAWSCPTGTPPTTRWPRATAASTCRCRARRPVRPGARGGGARRRGGRGRARGQGTAGAAALRPDGQARRAGRGRRDVGRHPRASRPRPPGSGGVDGAAAQRGSGCPWPPPPGWRSSAERHARPDPGRGFERGDPPLLGLTARRHRGALRRRDLRRGSASACSGRRSTRVCSRAGLRRGVLRHARPVRRAVPDRDHAGGGDVVLRRRRPAARTRVVLRSLDGRVTPDESGRGR